MITFKAINTTGMFSNGMIPTIPLDDRGIVFIRGINEDNGGSNGSGKSSLPNAIKEILFGKNDTGKSGSFVINKHNEWRNGSFGAVWFSDHNGIDWRVFDVKKWKGDPPDPTIIRTPSEVLSVGNTYTGGDIFLERWNGILWIDERATSVGDKRYLDTRIKLITQILQMTYEQFSAYVCLGQTAESALVQGTSKSREKIIQAVVDVSIWNAAADIVKNLANNKDIELNRINNEIIGMQSVLSTLVVPTHDELQAATNAVIEAQNKLVEAQNTVSQLEASIQEKQHNLDILCIDGIEQEFDILSAEERHSRERLDNFNIPEQPAGIINMETSIGKLKYKLMEDRSKLQNYNEVGIGECDRCGQYVYSEYLGDIITRVKDDIASNEMVLKVEETSLKKMKEEHDVAVNVAYNEAKIRYDEEIHYLNKSKSTLENKKSEAESIKTGIQQLLLTQTQWITITQTQPQQVALATQYLQRLQNRESEAKQVHTNINNLQSKAKHIEDEITHIRWVERNLKKLRIQEYTIAIDRLNMLLASRINDVWGPDIYVRYVTAQEKVRGGIKQGIDIVIDTPNKSGIPIELYSGGETKSIIVANFLAMRDFIKERGGGVNIAGIDELDESLDDFKTDKLVDAFNTIANSSSTCLIISHNSRLLNTMRFDEIWTMRKTNGFTTIEIGN